MAALPPGMYYRNQRYLNTLFQDYQISFQNPNYIVYVMTQLIRTQLAGMGLQSQRDFFRQVQRSNCNGLWNVMRDIGELPHHRHRIDARNITDEVRSRIFQGNAPRTLLPTPMEPDYEGPDRRVPDIAVEQLETYYRAAIEDRATQLVWEAGDRYPRAWRTAATEGERLEYVPPNNMDALELIVQEESTSQMVRDAVFNILSADPPPNVKTVPVRLDNPAEVCLEMPEDCRFLNDPTPTSNRMTRFLEQEMYELEVWDYRLGERDETSTLDREHYIYQLVALVRDVARQPDVARAYAIIFRADPLRYAASSTDEIVDEPPPTAAESW